MNSTTCRNVSGVVNFTTWMPSLVVDASRTVMLSGIGRSNGTLLSALARAVDLGAAVAQGGATGQVTRAPLRGPAQVDVGLAGTVMRFVPPIAALADGPVAFDGDPRSRERPLRPLLDALSALGVDIDDGGRGA